MKNKKICFRPMNHEDIEMVSQWLSDSEDISLFDRSVPLPMGPEFVRESWKPALEYKEPPSAVWFVIENTDREAMGIAGLQGINYIHGDAIVPLFIARPFRYKGLAKIIMLALIDFAFDSLRLHRLTTFFRSDNEVSQKLTEFGGFVEEGRVREGWYANGKHYDVVRVGLLKSDWMQIRQSVSDQLSEAGYEVVSPVPFGN